MKEEIYNSHKAEEILMILDNCFGNIFVTDSLGKVLYMNESSSKCLGVDREKLLTMTSGDMLQKQIMNHSVPLRVIAEKRRVIDSVFCYKTGISLSVVGNPVFDGQGNLSMVVCFSQVEQELNDLIAHIEEERHRSKQALSYVDTTIFNKYPIICVSQPSKAIFQYATTVAASDTPVMLQGESGTGKEVLARHIHQNSPRSSEAFIPVNCSSIPANLMESEFFGYSKGAFTGANTGGKAGVFELAHNGTLFLDEVAELPLELQPKLLRVLENGEYTRLGSTKMHRSNVRIIAATNQDLMGMVNNGRFRRDLYYRLNVVPIHLPLLRDRTEDIKELANMFVATYNKKYRLSKYIPERTMDVLLRYNWPGNIRELRNVIERLVVTTAGDALLMDWSELKSVSIPETGAPFTVSTTHKPYTGGLKDRVQQFEIEQIQSMVDACQGDTSMAAKMLGISRSGLYYKLSTDHH